MNATGLHTLVYAPPASHEKCFYFLKDHQFKNLILNKVIIKYSSTVRWHMAEEILIAVIFVEFQRHIGQLYKIQVNLLANEEMGSVLINFSVYVVNLLCLLVFTLIKLGN